MSSLCRHRLLPRELNDPRRFSAREQAVCGRRHQTRNPEFRQQSNRDRSLGILDRHFLHLNVSDWTIAAIRLS